VYIKEGKRRVVCIFNPMLKKTQFYGIILTFVVVDDVNKYSGGYGMVK